MLLRSDSGSDADGTADAANGVGMDSAKVKNAANTHTEEPADGHDDHMDGLNGFVTTRPDAAPPTEEQARKDIEEELDKWDEYFESEYSHMGI